jgi:hypothetical protein
MNQCRVLCVMVLLFALGSGSATAQRVVWDVIGSGGCIGSSSTLHWVSATVGQPSLGVLTGSGHRIHSGFWNPWLSGGVGVGPEGGLALPVAYALSQNFPNPFGPATTIQYAIPRQSQVTVAVFNLRGERVDVLADQACAPGYYVATWDGMDAFGRVLGSGVYLCRMTTRPVVGAAFEQTREMVLVR